MGQQWKTKGKEAKQKQKKAFASKITAELKL